ncbi:MAG: antibiotic biosynthesis monooxygenase [Proteobacteria bacterium]|nr:antibiotic biosynthesis monooxygenase [Pseudomonadota bacterium]
MEQTNKHSGIDCDTPVTIIVKHRPKPDRIEDFEKIMSGTTKDAMTFKGHLGANILRPSRTGDSYRIVFKFDSMRNYLAWEGSEIRQQWLVRYAEVSLDEHEQEILSGLETWFTLPGEEALVPPPKHKMMIIIWLSIFPLSLLLYYCLNPYLSDLHNITQMAITSLILVMLMTYVVMPLMSKLFHRWLHCSKQQ